MTTHFLTFLANEDEAQMTGYRFEVDGDTVTITETFHNPAYAAHFGLAPKRMTREEARQFWRDRVATGDFAPVE